MKLSVVIPARNESESLSPTLIDLYRSLESERIEHEIVVVDDGSIDSTPTVLANLKTKIPTLLSVRNPGQNGYGRAVQVGLTKFTGQCVAVMMADGSDDPKDLIRFFRQFETGETDNVFGTRFSRQSKVTGYPIHKWLLNRMVNRAVQLLFSVGYNDMTNAFKLYGAHVIPQLQPLLSPHFNLTVELPLKSIVRGFSYKVLPNSWTGRSKGYSKLKIREMGSRYLFIILYCFIEKWLSRGDYRRTKDSGPLVRTQLREVK